MATVAPIVVAVAVTVAGVVGGSAVPALLFALLVSLAGNVFLVYWLSKAHARGWDEAMAEAIRAIEGPDATSNRWLQAGAGLDALAFTTADFEESMERARETARVRLGDDAMVRLGRLQLLPKIDVWFDAWSVTADRRAYVHVRPASVEVTSIQIGTLSWSEEPPLWRTDTSWPDLIRKSWQRMRPFNGMVLLAPKHRHATDEGWSGWHMVYQPEIEGVRGEEVGWSLHDDVLESVPPW